MAKVKRGERILKKLYKWPGLIIAFFFLYFSLTGIIMNHREWLGGVDLSRKNLPKEYQFNNWNNAALKGYEFLSSDSLLIYGNVGIWLTDSAFSTFTEFNNGLPKCIDYQKIFDVYQTKKRHLYAATLFSLYGKNSVADPWQKIHLDMDIKSTVGVESKGDTLVILNRSYIFWYYCNFSGKIKMGIYKTINDHMNTNVNKQWQYVHNYYYLNCLLPLYFWFNFHDVFIVFYEISSRTGFFKDFYILIVPLSSLIGTMVLLSGYFLWRKRYRKR